MPKMTYGETVTTMEVPAGRYVARFTGTEDREPFKESKFGGAGDGGPRLGWLFEVVEGQYRGKKISQESGLRASPKSTAARVVAGLAGGQVAVGQAVDTDQFIGRLYVVKVAVNPNSDKGNLHVADIEPHQQGGNGPAAGAAPASAGNPATAPARPSAPPLRPQPQKSAAAPNNMYWYAVSGKEAEQIGHKDLQEYLDAHLLNPAEEMVCLVGSEEWRTAASFGFTAKGY
jgi:hypothetical protein